MSTLEGSGAVASTPVQLRSAPSGDLVPEIASGVFAALRRACAAGGDAVMTDTLGTVLSEYGRGGVLRGFSEWAPGHEPWFERVSLSGAEAFADSTLAEPASPASAVLLSSAGEGWSAEENKSTTRWGIRLHTPEWVDAVAIEWKLERRKGAAARTVAEVQKVDGGEYETMPNPVGVEVPELGSPHGSMLQALFGASVKSEEEDEADGDGKVDAGEQNEYSAYSVVPVGTETLALRLRMDGFFTVPEAAEDKKDTKMKKRAKGAAAGTGPSRHSIARIVLLRWRRSIPSMSPSTALAETAALCRSGGEWGAATALTAAVATGSLHLALSALLSFIDAEESGKKSGDWLSAAAVALQRLDEVGDGSDGKSLAEAAEPAAATGLSSSKKGSGNVVAMFDPVDISGGCELSEGDTMYESTTDEDNWAIATKGFKQGKATFEFLLEDDYDHDEQTCFGFTTKPVDDGNYSSSGGETKFLLRAYTGEVYTDGVSTYSCGAVHPGDIVKFEVDMKADNCTVYVNGDDTGSFDSIPPGEYYPMVSAYCSGRRIKFVSYSVSGVTVTEAGKGKKGRKEDDDSVSLATLPIPPGAAPAQLFSARVAVTGSAGVGFRGKLPNIESAGGGEPCSVGGTEMKSALTFATFPASSTSTTPEHPSVAVDIAAMLASASEARDARIQAARNAHAAMKAAAEKAKGKKKKKKEKRKRKKASSKEGDDDDDFVDPDLTEPKVPHVAHEFRLKAAVDDSTPPSAPPVVLQVLIDGQVAWQSRPMARLSPAQRTAIATRLEANPGKGASSDDHTAAIQAAVSAMADANAQLPVASVVARIPVIGGRRIQVQAIPGPALPAWLRDARGGKEDSDHDKEDHKESKRDGEGDDDDGEGDGTGKSRGGGEESTGGGGASGGGKRGESDDEEEGGGEEEEEEDVSKLAGARIVLLEAGLDGIDAQVANDRAIFTHFESPTLPFSRGGKSGAPGTIAAELAALLRERAAVADTATRSAALALLTRDVTVPELVIPREDGESVSEELAAHATLLTTLETPLGLQISLPTLGLLGELLAKLTEILRRSSPVPEAAAMHATSSSSSSSSSGSDVDSTTRRLRTRLAEARTLRWAAHTAESLARVAEANLRRFVASGVSLEGIGAKRADDCPELKTLHRALDALVHATEAAIPQSLRVRAADAIDAGLEVFYPTAEQRRKLVAEVLEEGATLEVHFSFPTVSKSAASQHPSSSDSSSSSSSSSTATSLREKAIGELAMRDPRFDRVLTLLHLECEQFGWRTELLGKWGGFVHLLVQLPPAREGGGAKSDAVTFLESGFATVLRRAGMRGWRIPQGCANPRIHLEIRRFAAFGSPERHFEQAGTGFVRLFPASACSFEEALGGVQEELRESSS